MWSRCRHLSPYIHEETAGMTYEDIMLNQTPPSIMTGDILSNPDQSRWTFRGFQFVSQKEMFFNTIGWKTQEHILQRTFKQFNSVKPKKVFKFAFWHFQLFQVCWYFFLEWSLFWWIDKNRNIFISHTCRKTVNPSQYSNGFNGNCINDVCGSLLVVMLSG